MPAIYEHEHAVRPDEVDDRSATVEQSGLCPVAAGCRRPALGGDGMADGAGIGPRTTAGSSVRTSSNTSSRRLRTRRSSSGRGWRTCSRSRRFANTAIVRPSDAALLVRAETNWAFVRMSDLKLTRIPEAVRESFELHSES